METYEEFINGILEFRGRRACGDEYHEEHHIVPRCCNGSDEEENLIDLFAREHFIAHKLLALENPDNEKLLYAWTMMSWAKNGTQDRYQVTPEEYEEARIAKSIALKGKHFGGGMPGIPKSEEHKKKLSESHKGKRNMKGNNNPNYGKHQSQEARKKMSENHADVSGENNPNYGNHKLAGANNPKARQIIRLSDLKTYTCGIYAAEDNNVCKTTIYNYCKRHKDFMYYDEWLLEQNNSY